jgi:hypothetical protein
MKIIISKKCREHMGAHKKDFFRNWEEELNYIQADSLIHSLTKDFEVMTIELSKPTGFSALVETTEKDDVVYAKRVGRETYTRFVKNKEKEITSNLVVILKRNKFNPEEYYLITMYPGTESLKEPEDINISSKDELLKSIDFWNRHALIYDESIIDKSTIKTYCPYKNMLLAIA